MKARNARTHYHAPQSWVVKRVINSSLRVWQFSTAADNTHGGHVQSMRNNA